VLGGRAGLRADLALEVQARQMRHLSKALGTAGALLLAAGAGALLAGGTFSFLLGLMGALLGGMLLIAAAATRFAAGQQEIHLAAVMAQMEEDRGPVSPPDDPASLEDAPNPPRYARSADEGDVSALPAMDAGR